MGLYRGMMVWFEVGLSASEDVFPRFSAAPLFVIRNVRLRIMGGAHVWGEA